MTFLGRIVGFFLRRNVSRFLAGISTAAGAVAVLITPREEEPQNVVPVMDVRISLPGLPAAKVERQAATSLEKLLGRLTEGEHVVYTSSGSS